MLYSCTRMALGLMLGIGLGLGLGLGLGIGIGLGTGVVKFSGSVPEKKYFENADTDR